MSEHLDTVKIERSKYPATQYGPGGTVLNPIGLEGAWDISNRTAYTWRSEGWGLLAKPSGSNWQGYSVDVIVNVREQHGVDILGDSEGAARPQWVYLPWEPRFVELWRAPVPPDDTPQPPQPPDALEARVAALEAQVSDLVAAARHVGSVWSGV